MVKRKNITPVKYIFAAAFTIIIFFSPLLLNPNILTTKNNDLARNYIPMIDFIHNSFWDWGQIPLWRGEQLMGETFVGNPLSSLFFPTNILFVFLPAQQAAFTYIYLDFLMAALFTFMLARSYKFSRLSSFSSAIFYALSTKMLVHLEAGHITMLSAFALFPLSFLALRKLIEMFNFSWLVIGAFSLTCIYFAYPTIFYYSTIFLGIYSLYKMQDLKDLKQISKSIIFLFALSIGLSAILLIPQLELGPLSTRDSLTLQDVAIPLWNFKKFLFSLLFPYINLTKVNHEEFLYFGAAPTFLALFGFTRLKRKQKITLAIIGTIAIFFAAGLSTPIFKLAYNYMPLLNYSRVTTRLWFAVALVVALLSGYALEKLNNKRITFLLLGFFLMETAFIFNTRFKSLNSLSYQNEELYQYISKDVGLSRAYCTTACFDSQLLSKHKIQILEGENPIQQKAFINFLSEAGNYKWGKFAVIFPPYEVWQVKNPPIPNARLLGQANVKYIASTYPIGSADFKEEGVFGDIYLYKNEKFIPRAYFLETQDKVKIQTYSPNKISLNFRASDNPRALIFSENYYPGWSGYVDTIKLNVEPYGVFRKIVVPANYENLDLKFQPKSYTFGKTITLATISFLVIYFFKSRKGKISQ